MKKLLLTFALSGLMLSTSVPSDKVYVCNGPKSTRYHLKKDCSGLNNCSTAIQETSLKVAKEKNRTLCKLED